MVLLSVNTCKNEQTKAKYIAGQDKGYYRAKSAARSWPRSKLSIEAPFLKNGSSTNMLENIAIIFQLNIQN